MGGIGDILTSPFKSKGNKGVTAGKVNQISPEEQALLTLMMGMYENPKLSPAYIADQYLSAMGKAESFYNAFPSYAEKKLTEANASYAQELSGIQRTPGTGISFDGKPITTVFPLKTMATQAGLATDKYTGAHDTITDTLAAKTAAQEALSKIAADRYAATITPIQSLWNSMYQGRFGGSVGVTAYEPSWAEKFLSAASGAVSGAGKAGA
jgi:hypothetical protein